MGRQSDFHLSTDERVSIGGVDGSGGHPYVIVRGGLVIRSSKGPPLPASLNTALAKVGGKPVVKDLVLGYGGAWFLLFADGNWELDFAGHYRELSEIFESEIYDIQVRRNLSRELCRKHLAKASTWQTASRPIKIQPGALLFGVCGQQEGAVFHVGQVFEGRVRVCVKEGGSELRLKGTWAYNQLRRGMRHKILVRAQKKNKKTTRSEKLVVRDPRTLRLLALHAAIGVFFFWELRYLVKILGITAACAHVSPSWVEDKRGCVWIGH